MNDNPDDIKRDIDRTRAALASDVDTLTEKVSPSRIIERRVDRARGAMTRAKERVMGVTERGTTTSGSAMSAAGDKARSTASAASEALSSTASNVADIAATAPETARRSTQGNPYAAGLIAFGAGWLASSLLPASEKETRIAAEVKDRVSDVAEPMSQVAKDVADKLREPAQRAMYEIRSSASDAASTVGDTASSAANALKDQTQEAATQVRNDAT